MRPGAPDFSINPRQDDGSGIDVSVPRTLGVETAEFSSRRVGLVEERTVSLEIGLKLYHEDGLGAGRQQSIAEAPSVKASMP